MDATGARPVVLVVEDSAPTRELLKTVLERGGYRVVTAEDGTDALRTFDAHRPEVVLLDLHLPGTLGGLEVLRRVRERGERPVLVLSGIADERTKVRALVEGADDYVVKPASAAELLARITALQRRLRRSGGEPDETVYDDGVLTVDPVGRVARARGREIALTPLEFRLLCAFVREPGRILSRDELLERVWGDFSGGSSEHVKLYVGYLRRKLAAVLEGQPVETVRGFGYRWTRSRVPHRSARGA